MGISKWPSVDLSLYTKRNKMNLEKLENDKKLLLCKKYFKGGFALLPFLWVVNAFWFFNEAFRRDHFEEQKEIKKYVLLSVLGAVISTSLLIAWIVIFQTHRVSWGEFGDDLSIVIPTGMP